MRTITVSYTVHRNEQRILLRFEQNEQMNNLVRKLNRARFSKTMQCWHIPADEKAYHHFKVNLPSDWNLVEILDNKHSLPPPKTVVPINPAKVPLPARISLPALNTPNKQAMAQFLTKLELKSYSPSTIRTYRNEFGIFLSVLNKREAETITPEELKRYMHYCTVVLHLSENTLHSRLNALKFYFEQVLRRDKFFFDIPRPKKPFLLPKVLGENEIGRLFSALENKKHKAILFTAYSAGLRVSEVVNLQLSDIDSDRMQILVRQAKGKKDRYVMLSPVLLDILRSYIAGCVPRPRKYLFEGNQPLEPMSSRTAQQIFQDARFKAGIHKQLSFHSLRHSFATHLLENGVDIKYIKDLLGHFSITTTTRYLHVKKENLVNIMSPLDDIFKKGKITF